MRGDDLPQNRKMREKPGEMNHLPNYKDREEYDSQDYNGGGSNGFPGS